MFMLQRLQSTPLTQVSLNHQRLFRTTLSIALLALGAEVAAKTVTVAWDPVDDQRVARYELHWGTQPGQYQSTQQVASTSTSIAGLVEGETYFFAARACDAAGTTCSDFSREFRATVGYSAPVPRFSASKTRGLDTLTVVFNDSSAGKIDGYRWDFGDGHSSSSATAVHTYDRPGSYSVSLTVTGPGGTATETKTDLISVSAARARRNSENDTSERAIDDAERLSAPIVGDSELPIEAGEIAIDHEWRRVSFARAFIDPVVVATAVSGNDAAPVTVRIAAIDQEGFFVRLQEWDYLDDAHATETLGYLVVERGSHQLPNGAWLEADEIVVGTGRSWQSSRFLAPFSTSPVLLSSVATNHDTSPVATRLRRITPTDFEVMMQGEEAKGIAHASEMVAYVAWEASCGRIGDLGFSVGKSADRVTHAEASLDFTDQCASPISFTAAPVLLTDMQTTDGQDTANLRWARTGVDSARIWVDEEQSRDAELAHTTEVVGYLAIGETDPPSHY